MVGRSAVRLELVGADVERANDQGPLRASAPLNTDIYASKCSSSLGIGFLAEVEEFGAIEADAPSPPRSKAVGAFRRELDVAEQRDAHRRA